jgi:hypothetical protein
MRKEKQLSKRNFVLNRWDIFIKKDGIKIPRIRKFLNCRVDMVNVLYLKRLVSKIHLYEIIIK